VTRQRFVAFSARLDMSFIRVSSRHLIDARIAALNVHKNDPPGFFQSDVEKLFRIHEGISRVMSWKLIATEWFAKRCFSMITVL